jgi:hypothetical protein
VVRDYVLVLVLDARIYAIEQEYSSPPFTEISWEISDSFRENAFVSSFIVNASPKEWKEALNIAIVELYR